MKIITTATETDFEKYYRLRYEVLRALWQQLPGSEITPDNATATHPLMLTRPTPPLAFAACTCTHPLKAKSGLWPFVRSTKARD